MGLLTGESGAINAIDSIGSWNIRHGQALAEAIASNTAGATHRMKGNADWSGSYESFAPLPATSILNALKQTSPTTPFTFTGSVDGTNGYTGSAVLDSVVMQFNLEAAEQIKHTVNFSGAGALTKGTAAGVDSTTPAFVSGIDLKLRAKLVLASPATWADALNVAGWRSATLTFTRNNVAYQSVEAPGIVSRKRGNFDASLSYQVYEADPTALPTAGDHMHYRMYVTSTLFWELLGFHVSDDIADMSVNLANAMVSGSVNTQFSSHSKDGLTPFADRTGLIETAQTTPVAIYP